MIRVTIDGIDYIPITEIRKGSSETAKAIIRMFVSDHYLQMTCLKSEGTVRSLCDCSVCHGHRIAVAYLGGEPKPKEETDAGFKVLWDSTR